MFIFGVEKSHKYKIAKNIHITYSSNFLFLIIISQGLKKIVRQKLDAKILN